MKASAELILNTIKGIYPSGIYLPLALGALLFLLVRKKNRAGRFVAVYSALFLLLFLLPPVAYVLSRAMGIGDVYWRMFWIFPYLVLIPAACVELISLSSKRVLNVLTAAVLIAALVLGGRTVYNEREFIAAPSREKLTEMTLIIDDEIKKNKEATGNSYVYLACPANVTTEIRQADASVILYRGRMVDLSNIKNKMRRRFIRTLFYREKDKRHTVRRMCRRHHINYIVIFSECGADKDLEKAGYQILYGRNGWNLWFNPDTTPYKGYEKKVGYVWEQQT